MDDMIEHELEVLEMLAGKRKAVWDAWVYLCCEALEDRGLARKDRSSAPRVNYEITEDGREFLRNRFS
jgi:hypothetical protein